MENSAPTSSRLRNYRFRPQYSNSSSAEDRRKRSRVDYTEVPPPPLREVETSENNAASTTTITTTTTVIDNGGKNCDNAVQKEIGPPLVQQHNQQQHHHHQQQLAKSSQESENDYGIDFHLDEEDEKQLADIFETYAAAAKRLPASSNSTIPTVEVGGAVTHEHEPIKVFDIEQLETLRQSGNVTFEALFVPNRGEDGATLLDKVIIGRSEELRQREASGRFEPQVEKERAEEGDLQSTNKSVPIQANIQGLEAVDPDKALRSEAKKDPDVPVQEIRSPLQLYRARGKRREPRLSVTDLVMNLWCEQQFHYTLLRGFKRRTPAMRAGTAIHKTVEEEVHTVVPVDVKTPEDSWGLKIYNMLQGIETLRHGGVTRELEVWGWIDGVWTIGVVDEIRFEKEAYDAFSEKVEEAKPAESKKAADEESVVTAKEEEGDNGEKKEANTTTGSENVPETPKKRRGRPPKKSAAKADEGSNGGSPSISSETKETVEPVTPKKGKEQQRSIDTFFSPSPSKLGKKVPKPEPVYVVDLKTRASDKPPKMTSSQGQMTFLQLMLYHRLISDLLTSHPKQTTDYLCDFHKLDPQSPFSDSFIAQIASLEMAEPPSSSTGGGFQSSPLSLESLLEHNSIEKLYGLFHEQLRKTISAVQPELTAVYRWQANGEIIGATSFTFDPDTLKEHVSSVMSWWKGQRATVGVGIHEAWKCRSCDFYDQCGWRKKKVEEGEEALRKKREETVSKENTTPDISDLVEDLKRQSVQKPTEDAGS